MLLSRCLPQQRPAIKRFTRPGLSSISKKNADTPHILDLQMMGWGCIGRIDESRKVEFEWDTWIPLLVDDPGGLLKMWIVRISFC